ncbi:hypothetical protein ONZ45_g9799 [Pleurotus djamor]|nr:hypothetical protein ONZ45_g9799 [Pleurotus djamor]
MIMKLAVIVFFATLAQAASDNSESVNAIEISTGYPACKPVATPTRFEPLAFNSSRFIWTGEVPRPGGNNPLAVRGFRKTVDSPSGKCATCAEVLVAADDRVQVFVNGQLIGGNRSWRMGSILFTVLKPSSNVFAFLGNNTNDQTPAGVVATIKLHYADGTSDTIVTDDSWKTLRGVAPPESFAETSFDDSAWTSAVVQGAPSHTALPPVLSLNQSTWIWTSEPQGSPTNIGSRAFRKTVSDCTKRAVCATVVIVADDAYTLWVNGKTVGGAPRVSTADAWSIPNLEPTYNVFAVNATNIFPGHGGLIGTIVISYSDGTTETIVTDASWLVSRDASEGFQEVIVDESGFAAATEVLKFGAPGLPIPVIPAA